MAWSSCGYGPAGLRSFELRNMTLHRSRLHSPLLQFAACLAATVLMAASPVRANGAFPDEFSIHFPPGAPNRILIGANFGLLISEDDGATWRYSCEPWIVAG